VTLDASPKREGPGRRLRSTLLGVLLAVVGAASGAQPAVKQVLLLQSLNRGNLVLDEFTGDFRVRLDERVGKPVNVVQVVVGPTGFVGAPDQAVVDYIRSTYADRPPPDLVMTVGGPAAAFARRHRGSLFPDAPLLFAAVDQRYLRDAPPADNETAVAVTNDFPRLVDGILQVLPDTKHVFMVIGSGSLGRFWRQALEEEFARFRGRLTFDWSDELSLPDIVRRVARLPSHSAIVYLTFGTDAQGGAYADQQVLDDIRGAANAPMFGGQSSLLGHGIVGGSMISIGGLARNTADVAARIVNGPPAPGLGVPIQFPGEPVFDWRELQRWGIPESRLPPGSVVRFRGPSPWDEYRPFLLTAVGVLTFQSLLIAWLLYERRARRRAEFDSRRNLALAADANRRETVSALTSSIGHELSQPLSAILHDAQALRTMLAAGRATPAATGEVLVDIEGEAALATQIIERHRRLLRSHELNRKPIDLRSVIDEGLALAAHDLQARQIEAVVEPSASACVVDGDQVLLVQVLLNLVKNAMDALAEMPPARRRMTITTAVTADHVELWVRDTGVGLAPDTVDTLFAPFFTTKPHGLGIGLAIAQRIVDAHGGTIGAEANPEGGAVFTVTLPRSATPRRPSEPAGGSEPSARRLEGAPANAVDRG
jgi:signal transduction histidine kinase